MLKSEQVGFNLLKTKDVYAILDGDKSFRSDALDEDVSLPYQSGPMLVEVLNKFGIDATYDSSSRWMYVNVLLEHCIENNRVSDMLAYFFSLERFQNDFYGLTPEEIKRRHGAVVEGAIAAINSVLFFGGHELRCFGNNYVIVSVDDVPEMSIPSINTIDRSYIKDMAERAQEDIELGNFDSALTKARTLLEEVFCWAIERKGVQPSSSGDVGKLFSQVKCLYNIHADSTMDRRICDLVNGLNKIVDSIGQMRNKQGDAHGVGASRVNIEDYHARLAVNAAANVADFVLSVVHRAERNGH